MCLGLLPHDTSHLTYTCSHTYTHTRAGSEEMHFPDPVRARAKVAYERFSSLFFLATWTKSMQSSAQQVKLLMSGGGSGSQTVPSTSDDSTTSASASSSSFANDAGGCGGTVYWVFGCLYDL